MVEPQMRLTPFERGSENGDIRTRGLEQIGRIRRLEVTTHPTTHRHASKDSRNGPSATSWTAERRGRQVEELLGRRRSAGGRAARVALARRWRLRAPPALRGR